MTNRITICIIATLLVCCTVSASTGTRKRRNNVRQKKATVKTAFSRSLPALDGKNLQMKVVEVTYGPGESSAAHSHPCPVVGYVLEGSVRMQVKGEQEAVYKPGDTFYEAPNGVHQVSANASQTEPAKFLAIFVCDHETPLTLPPVKSGKSEGK